VSQRLFFALWPDAAVRAELERRFGEFVTGLRGGRLQRPDQWHVTLEFVGETADERVADIEAAADEVRAEPFELRFDNVDHWRRSGVLLLAATQTPPELVTLVSGLRAALAARGHSPEQRPFRPHVTLARKVASGHPHAPAEPLVWPVGRYSLARSVTSPTGSRYEPVRWWNLVRRRA
jgi:RNA 2',3'-cyclic 3'-phosphodiesterase